MLILFPIILVLLIPTSFLVAISLMPEAAATAVPDSILSLLPAEISGLSYRPAMFSVFTSLIAPMFFISVPIICSVSIASVLFIGERNDKTLETLMLTSASNKLIFNSKLLSGSLMSVIVSLFSFIAFTVVASVGDAILGAPFFFNFDWFVLVILLMPALTVFCFCFISLMSVRIHGLTEAMQIMGYFILVVAALYIIQICGIFAVTAIVLLIISLLLIIADFVMYNNALKRFTSERMLTPIFIEKRLNNK